MENNIPKVSVVFPIYNNERYLEGRVRSVMNQTLKEIELILIDDGSTDGAPAICDRLAREDARIRVVHKKNEGSAAGRSQGIDLARGEFVAFVESDDHVAPDMYEKLYDRACRTNADIVKCGFYFCEENRRREADFFYGIGKGRETFTARECPDIFLFHASIWAALYRRSFVNEFGLRFIVTPGATYSDFSWMAMVYAYARRITVYPEALYYYTFDNPNSSFRQMGRKCFYILRHAREATRILREANLLDDVREEIGKNEYRACSGYARRVTPELRSAFFHEFRDVLTEVFGSAFQYKRFSFLEKHFAKLVVSGREADFYRQTAIYDRLVGLMSENRALQALLFQFKRIKYKAVG